MIRAISLTVVAVVLSLPVLGQAPAAQPSWFDVSNGYTKKLLAVEMKHRPEAGSDQGLSEYDALASQPTLADEDQERRETEAVLAELKRAVPQQKDKAVAQDLEIVIRKVELGFREQDFRRAHVVPFLNASGIVFGGLHSLLDEQTPAERRPAAVIRIREDAGLESGYKPLTEILKQR